MSVLESPLPTHLGADLPQLYLACPLTGLTDAGRRQILGDVAIIKTAIERATELDRVETESWPLNVYAPIDHTPPWGEDHLSPPDVYRRNLSSVHDSDAVIVLAEQGGSAGVGQELEWATKLGVPVAFLTAGRDISRQIAGVPGFISAQSYNKDPTTLEAQVVNFLRLWKPVILDGPRRRRSRQLRYEPLTLQLRGAWQSCPNRTDVAAQVRANHEYLELALSDARYVAAMATETLVELAHHLGVALHRLHPGPTFTLPVPVLRSLMAAADQDGWGDDTVGRLLYEGRDALGRGVALDLHTIAGWRTLRQQLSGDL